MDKRGVDIQIFFGCVGSSCFTQAFCSHEDYSLVVVHGLLTAVASLVTEQGSMACGLQYSWCMDLVACGIFPDQGSNLCPLNGRWTLNHQTTREVLYGL